MGSVAHHCQIVHAKVVNVFLVWIDLQCGKGARSALQLLLECIHMVEIDMRIPNYVDKITRFAASHLSYQMGQQSIRGNVEWYTQSHICAALVHLTGHFIADCIHVELAKHVTRRKRHFIQISRIPSRHDNSTIFGILFDFANAFR